MDQIIPGFQKTQIHTDEGTSDEAPAAGSVALPGRDKTTIHNHRCESCGQLVISGGVKDQIGKAAQQSKKSRQKKRPLSQPQALVTSDSENGDSDRASLTSESSSQSGSTNSAFEELSSSQNLDLVDEQTKPERVDILYKVKCSEKGHLDKTFYSVAEFSGLEVYQVDTDQASIIEIITGVKGKSLSPNLKGQRKAQFQRNLKTEGIQFGRNFMVSEIMKTSLVVHSEALQNAIRHVVKYFPSQTMTGRKLTFQYPYEPLFIHYKRLKAYKYELENGYKIPTVPKVQNSTVKSLSEGAMIAGASDPTSTSIVPSDINETLDTDSPNFLLEEKTAYDIGVLVSFLAPEYEHSIESEKALHARGLASYKMLWLLLEPGIEVYGLVDGQYAAFVVTMVAELGNRSDYESWQVTVWALASAGGKIIRKQHLYEIFEFGGERDITSLEIFPCKYLDIQDGGKTKTRLEAQGRRYYDILSKLPMHLTYSGSTLDQKPITYRGQIIVDPKGYLKHFREQQSQRPGPPPPPRPPGQPRRVHHFAYESHAKGDGDPEKPADFGGGEMWKNYNNIDPKAATDNNSAMTPHHYRLLPRHFLGFALKVKVWMIFDLDNITPVVWPDANDDPMKHLVLPKRDKDIVQALSKKFEKGNESTWSADFIEDKGAGQVFLLHGPPGTGKTYTVECVAKYAQRPLLPLTVADIGTLESNIQAKLEKWFDLGENWGAILLIDEADVFLESRTTASLQRNSLVSVFLRTMEYYTGMLFLTTNRMGQIDDAFLSRIQVALGYSKLSTDAQMSIWEGFFEKLEDERRDLVISQRAKTFVLTDEKFRQMGWNGREIRNALHTAIALATHEKNLKKRDNRRGAGTDIDDVIEISEKHFEQLRERREVFIAYRDSIDRRTEEQRAAAAKDRARFQE